MSLSVYLLAIIVILVILINKKKFVRNNKQNTQLNFERRKLKQPRALPIIGSLHLLADSGGPFAAFTKLSATLGDIYEIRLGDSRCVVVSSYPLVKEVLITRGSQFSNRPDFLRFHQIFGGDRNNCKNTSFIFHYF